MVVEVLDLVIVVLLLVSGFLVPAIVTECVRVKCYSTSVRGSTEWKFDATCGMGSGPT
jgi:hypothetical protein